MAVRRFLPSGEASITLPVFHPFPCIEVALLTADNEYEPFCSSFVALASHYLGGTAPSLPKTHLNGVLTASRVLLRYLLSSLDAQNANGSAAPCSLNQVSPDRIVSALINFIANIISVFPISCLTLCLSSSSLVSHRSFNLCDVFAAEPSDYTKRKSVA